MVNIIDPVAYSRLKDIAEATNVSGAYYSLNDAVLASLVQAGYAITNAAMVQTDQSNGQIVSIAARATEAGMGVWRAGNEATPVAAPQAWGTPSPAQTAPVVETAVQTPAKPAEKPVFVVETYDEIPVIARGTQLKPKEAIYPWASTMPRQRFFIPQQISTRGDNVGKPVRHASAATSANDRIREEYKQVVDYNQRNPNAPLALPVAKHFKCVTVKAGQYGAVADGEFMYCAEGLAPEPKPRAKKTEVAAQ